MADSDGESTRQYLRQVLSEIHQHPLEAGWKRRQEAPKLEQGGGEKVSEPKLVDIGEMRELVEALIKVQRQTE